MEQMSFDFNAPRPVRKMVWNEENKSRLISLASQTPRPSNAELARRLGTTVGAIEVALWRFGGSIGHGAKTKNLSAVPQRKCLRCGQPFAREHRHAFMCRDCNNEIAKMAA